MKKTLIALAALASIGSAFAADAPATPTITPYARLDIGLSSTQKTGANDTGLVGTDSAYNTSLWGIKGETDLGSGMKGFAKVEQKFAANGPDGLATPGNSRVGFIGVSGGFGSVALGAVWGPYDNITIGDAQDYNKFSPYSTQLNAGAHGDNGNGGVNGQTTGSIMYTSPSFGGLVFEGNYAPKKDATNSTDISSYGLDVQYTAGPLAVAAAYDSTPTSVSNVGTGAKVDGKAKGWLINGSYDLGVVAIFAAVSGANVDGTALGSDKDSGYSIGVKAPLGKWTVSGSYGTVKTSGDDMNQHSDAFGVQGLYAFNKQFTAYVGAKNTKMTPDVGASVTTNYYAAGLTMSF